MVSCLTCLGLGSVALGILCGELLEAGRVEGKGSCFFVVVVVLLLFLCFGGVGVALGICVARYS